MNEPDKILTDPFGNKIRLPASISMAGPLAEQQYDKLEEVITRPIMVIRSAQGQLHFIRALSWENTILLTASPFEEGFEVVSCQQDPPTSLLSKFLQGGEQLI